MKKILSYLLVILRKYKAIWQPFFAIQIRLNFRVHKHKEHNLLKDGD